MKFTFSVGSQFSPEVVSGNEPVLTPGPVRAAEIKPTLNAPFATERHHRSGYLRALPLSDGCSAVTTFSPVPSKAST